MSRPLPFAYALSDDCRCKWANDAPGAGWRLTAWNPACPVHPDEGSQR